MPLRDNSVEKTVFMPLRDNSKAGGNKLLGSNKEEDNVTPTNMKKKNISNISFRIMSYMASYPREKGKAYC